MSLRKAFSTVDCDILYFLCPQGGLNRFELICIFSAVDDKGFRAWKGGLSLSEVSHVIGKGRCVHCREGIVVPAAFVEAISAVGGSEVVLLEELLTSQTRTITTHRRSFIEGRILPGHSQVQNCNARMTRDSLGNASNCLPPII